MNLRRIVVGACVLLGTAAPAHADWLVEVEGRPPVTVERYWQDGETAHLMRDGIDESVPRSRVRKVVQVADAPRVVVPKTEPTPAATKAPAHAPAHPSAAPVKTPIPTDPDELAARQAAVDKHLLRVQQARFEADARGDDPKRLNHLGREFRRTQERRRDLAHAAAELAAHTD